MNIKEYIDFFKSGERKQEKFKSLRVYKIDYTVDNEDIQYSYLVFCPYTDNTYVADCYLFTENFDAVFKTGTNQLYYQPIIISEVKLVGKIKENYKLAFMLGKYDKNLF